jgi:uroporphyrinogen decarboxylase
MLKEQWKTLVDVSEGKKFDFPPIALIVDSPWLPFYAEISHFDYYLLPDKWLAVNHKIHTDFPNIIFLPSFWVEYGMAIVPSAFGSLIKWKKHETPFAEKIISSIENINSLTVPDPKSDGLMPLTLNLYHHFYNQLKDKQHKIKIVASRGPLNIASFLRGLTDFLIDIKIKPRESKKFIEILTETVIVWFKALFEEVPSAEGLFLLDDIPGFLSPADYQEFAHPYLSRIFDEFPNKLKIYHNDANIIHILDQLKKLNMNIFNFGKQIPIETVHQVMKGKVAIMGNIPPVEILKDASPEKTKEFVLDVLKVTPKDYFILSVGGGVSQETPTENIAMLNKIAGKS